MYYTIILHLYSFSEKRISYDPGKIVFSRLAVDILLTCNTLNIGRQRPLRKKLYTFEGMKGAIWLRRQQQKRIIRRQEIQQLLQQP
nr:MAG TPA: hypothetical protein [Caudoviricetes sp.]